MVFVSAEEICLEVSGHFISMLLSQDKKPRKGDNQVTNTTHMCLYYTGELGDYQRWNPLKPSFVPLSSDIPYGNSGENNATYVAALNI